MNKQLEKALAKPDILLMGPIVSPTTGDKLPIHFSTKNLYSHPDSLITIAKEIGRILKKIKVDRIAGGETAGIPLVTAVSMVTKIPMIYVRKEKREYPRMSVEGIIKKGDKVALLDDSLVSGEHKELFMHNLRQAGARIKALIVIIDATNHSKEKERKKFLSLLKREKIRFFYLFQWPEWFKILGKYGYLSQAMTEIAVDSATNIVSWQNNPKKWRWFEKVKSKQKGKFV